MVNKCFFSGNLVRDPELRTLPTTSVVNFTIAVNTPIGKDKKEVAFIDAEAWDTAATMIYDNFQKGDGIFIECRARTDSWKNKETGKTASRLRHRVEHFIATVKLERVEGQSQNNSQEESAEPAVVGEEVPF